MKFFSTSGSGQQVSFREAVLRGLAPDNGLYYPSRIPRFSKEWLSGLQDYSLQDIGFHVLRPFTEGDMDENVLYDIVKETLNFPIPLVRLDSGTFVLELFHGPTLAFKDVGARFLARCLGYFSESGQDITVLVATSGDTGSAVGQGFLNVPGVKVKILYPSGKVSHLQEQQLTTLGQNIEAYEVTGTFDDCQRMVKEAFLDPELQENLTLTSANSINVARWLPQSIYYFWACAQLDQGTSPVISVPSGNYGNLAGGLLAKAMGLPIAHFIASSNANDVFPAYLHSGEFRPRASVKTLSNAMDVGNPSNQPRILELYDAVFSRLKKDISGFTCSDEETIRMIRLLKESFDYLPDPHGAVGYYGLNEYRKSHPDGTFIFLETAHPAKFKDTMEEIAGLDIMIPDRLFKAMQKEKRSVMIPPSLDKLKSLLLG
jgi:threonine synthase